MTKIINLDGGIFRIRHWTGREPRESLLSKYGAIDLAPAGEAEFVSEDGGSEAEIVTESYRLKFALSAGEDGGFEIRLPLAKSDRLFGLGDESRDCLEKHGKIAVMKQENFRSYGPMPYIMSSRGWAILINCTYAHVFDIASSEPDVLRIYSDKGALDMVVFCAEDLAGALFLAGKVMGRPVMLPKSAYGLTFVLNEQSDARSVLDDALRFRDRGIPCDVLGLEPSWMSKHYDYSTEKKWNKERFYLPFWKPEDYYGDCSFIWSLNRMGFSLSLWLCCRYDLFWKEEGDVLEEYKRSNPDAAIDDPRLSAGVRLDKTTKPGEDWFEHLKKFVDNGAEAFKLDGADQVLPFPDRLWAGRYLDDEIRNLYPVVYAKQMKEGFENYTGRRAMIYTPGVYPGMQKYAATWAGDTGCGPDVLLSLMNHAMCGHSNASFDMGPGRREIHFGFLAPWSQHLGWDNWRYPWYDSPETEECYRFYSRLRSSLFHYVYSFAHVANATSFPILRPLSLVYRDTDAYDGVFNEYMLGDFFLVVATDENVLLPEEDRWFDFFTGRIEERGAFTYVPEAPQCGALFVKAGSIVVMQDWAPSLKNNRPERLYVHVYPGKDADFELYEDDYSTYGYEKGEFAVTKMSLRKNVLTIRSREGVFPDMPPEFRYTVVWHREDGTTESVDAQSCEVRDGARTVRFEI
ncbi:MAG: glycoside hydrolase family 31 protein [Clostridia bacterium]|nr:glycoside hydrolase family 31 protein [Clostridia bacterium]